MDRRLRVDQTDAAARLAKDLIGRLNQPDIDMATQQVLIQALDAVGERLDPTAAAEAAEDLRARLDSTGAAAVAND